MNHDTPTGFSTEIAMSFRKRGGKAVIMLPNGERAIERGEALIDNSMVKLVARGHRWHRKLFDGTHAQAWQPLGPCGNHAPSDFIL
jgi:hypothetical protein